MKDSIVRNRARASVKSMEAFTESMNEIRKAVLGPLFGKALSEGVPTCDAEHAAAYLLTPELASRPMRGVGRGFCYFASRARLDLHWISAMKEHSPNRDGVFEPLSQKQRESLMQGVAQLRDLGIQIEACAEDSIERIFGEYSGYRKVVFYAFSNLFGEDVDTQHLGKRRYFERGPIDAPIQVDFIGFRSDDKMPLITFFHEIGHVLGFGHFPPNFGDFDAECAPDFFNATKLLGVQRAMKENMCAVDATSDHEITSVMFCTRPGAYTGDGEFTLPPCDSIAFKKRYDELRKVKDSDIQTPQDNQKDELALFTRQPQRLLDRYSPSMVDIVSERAKQGAALGAMQGVANAITHDERINCLLFHCFYFLYSLNRANRDNPEQGGYDNVLQAATDTMGILIFSTLLSFSRRGLAYAGDQLERAEWRRTGKIVTVAAHTVSYARYGYECGKAFYHSGGFFPNKRVAELTLSTASSIGSAYIAERVTETIGRGVGYTNNTTAKS